MSAHFLSHLFTRRYLNQVIGYIVSAALVLSHVGHYARAADFAELDAALDAAQDLRDTLERSQFDTEDLLLELDYQAGTIIDHVRSKVVFQQYSGLLRGARGTLMSRAGNALDQSVLLAQLLKDAGFDARIARGRLTEEQAGRLIERIAQAPDFGEMVQGGQSTSPELAGDLTALQPFLPTDQDVDFTTQDIMAVLDTNGVVLGDPTWRADLIAEAREYFWVQYRLGPAEDWQDVQPVFDGAENEFKALTATEFLSDSVPEDLLHQFRFSVFVEQRIGTDYQVHEIMTPWQRPVANLLGDGITYMNYPVQLAPQHFTGDLISGVRDSGLFLPYLNDALVPGALAFDRAGNVVSADALTEDAIGAAGVFETAAGKAQLATGALAQLGDDASGAAHFALTRQWIEYTLIAPGGDETSYRRVLFDNGSAAADQAGHEGIYDGLLSATHVQVTGSSFAPAYLYDRLLNQFQSFEALGRLSVEELEGEDADEKIVSALFEYEPLPDNLELLAEFDEDRVLPPDTISYRAEPSVVVLRASASADATEMLERSVDIVTNARRTFRRDASGGIVPDPLTNLRLGVRETFLEPLAVVSDTETIEDVLSVFSALQSAAANGSDYVLFDQQSSEYLDVFPVSDDIKAQIKGQLVGGSLVILPTQPVNDTQTAWWRLDPQTGTVLGYLYDGTGGSLVHQAIVLTIAAAMGVAIGVALYSGYRYLDCRRSGVRGAALSCCWRKQINKETRGMENVVRRLFSSAQVAVGTLSFSEQVCGEVTKTTKPKPTRTAPPPGKIKRPPTRRIRPAPTRPATQKGRKSPPRNGNYPPPTRPSTQER